jgi:D-glycero-alpha-D-manno-heptose-7-phosphate kinase
MIGALATWANQKINPITQGNDFIEIVRDVETTVIHVPAGLQDYYSAMYGGLQGLHWEAGTHRRTEFDPHLIAELEKRLLLFYSGQSRNSGINNWALFKGFIDQDQQIRERFEKIVTATRHLETALTNQDWTQVGLAIQAEWNTRKTLAAGISTPAIDQAFEETRKLAPMAGKVCGAGGGGCFFVYTADADPRLKSKIQEIFSRSGMRSLDFKGSPHGLEVKTS